LRTGVNNSSLSVLDHINYNLTMKSKSLSNTNRFLSRAKLRTEQVLTSVASSTAIETGQSIADVKAKIIHHRSVKYSALKQS